MKHLVCSFTGVYDTQRLIEDAEYLDFKELKGCGMYLDDTAAAFILSKIKPYSPGGLHFIDNGNYHYMTGLFLSFVKEDFDLVHFDHHRDDQMPAFSGLRSCGSWVADLKCENSFLKTYLLIQDASGFYDYRPSDRPLYISIDKDVLSERVLKTNWDQGQMEEDEFFSIFGDLIKKRRILGIDVCGEDEPFKDTTANEAFNLKLLDLCQSLFK